MAGRVCLHRASIAYTSKARHHFPGLPVILGGLEAGPRRFAYLDYWDEKLRRSVLVDAKADLRVWGMGERQVLEIAKRLDAGEGLRDIRGTCELRKAGDIPADARMVPSYEQLVEDQDLLIELFNAVREENSRSSQHLAQEHAGLVLLQHPPSAPAAQDEVDGWFDLPYLREWHPDHTAAGGIAALEPVRWSINTLRGCMADCSFCSITFHQGRTIQSRSEDSILREAAKMSAHHDFRGTITDVGGPTANMYGLGCELLEAGEACLDRDCLTPEPCPALKAGYPDGRLPAPAGTRARDTGRQAHLRQLRCPLRHAAQEDRRVAAVASRPGAQPRIRAHEARS
ncbi:MAG: putative radical SAM protein YgiQ [Chlamydiales bacterium]|jgi:uncharacterized radical SAM protein YgiQ